MAIASFRAPFLRAQAYTAKPNGMKLLRDSMSSGESAFG